jgi:hypothetical protein
MQLLYSCSPRVSRGGRPGGRSPFAPVTATGGERYSANKFAGLIPCLRPPMACVQSRPGLVPAFGSQSALDNRQIFGDTGRIRYTVCSRQPVSGAAGAAHFTASEFSAVCVQMCGESAGGCRRLGRRWASHRSLSSPNPHGQWSTRRGAGHHGLSAITTTLQGRSHG